MNKNKTPIFTLIRESGILFCLFSVFMLVSWQTQAQSVHKLLRKGNKLYKGQSYTDAEANYKKALLKDSSSGIGLFNLGNALYHQQRYKEAAKRYERNLSTKNLSKKEAASSQYNIGNTYMQGKDWGEAIKAYKKSLLANPGDDEARYNLAYARAMQKKNKKGGGKNNNQNKDQKNQDKQDQQKNQKDQKKDQQDQNKDQQQNQQNKPKDQDRKKQDKTQPQPEKMDKQRANQLLNAAAQHEKKIRDKKDKKKKGVKVYKGKQW